MPEQRRYGRFETWTQGALWRAETTDWMVFQGASWCRSWYGSGETEAEALAVLAEKLLADYENRGPDYA